MRYSRSGNSVDFAWVVAVSPDSTKVFVSGESGFVTQLKYATVAYDSSTGAQLWAKHYVGSSTSFTDPVTALAVSPDGTKVLVTGSGGNYNYVTVAYDASTGAMLWAKRYNGPGNSWDFAYSVAVSPDGTKVFVTGKSIGLGTHYDYATVAYDASTGAHLWTARYVGSSKDTASAVTVSPDGTKVFVTGASVGLGTSLDYATVAYDASTGTQIWATRYIGPSKDTASAVTVSPDATKVFVTGYSVGVGTSLDYATVAYDASTGTHIWATRYNGTGNSWDYSYAVAVSPNGTEVLVTGGSMGSTDSDYATIAYAV